MRVLVAPQEFKESLAAEEAADAIAAGIRRAAPGWEVDRLPLSDGGPGFVDALRRATRAEAQAVVVEDALGKPILGRYLVLPGRREAVVEAAQANGLVHIPPADRRPLDADSYGVGQLIAEALTASPLRLVVGVGGSASTDGGSGMARALGARLLDGAGTELGRGGGALRFLGPIEWSRPPALEGVEVLVASDVTNPLLGPSGAAAVFGPQKGATPGEVAVLDAGLSRFAEVVKEALGVDVGTLAGGGAAGGLGAGLVAFLGGRIVSGFDVVSSATGLEARLSSADVVVTGEGSFDSQSLAGKTTGRLIALAQRERKPCVVFAGQATERPPGVAVRTLAELEPDAEARMARASELLSRLAERWARAQV